MFDEIWEELEGNWSFPECRYQLGRCNRHFWRYFRIKPEKEKMEQDWGFPNCGYQVEQGWPDLRWGIGVGNFKLKFGLRGVTVKHPGGKLLLPSTVNIIHHSADHHGRICPSLHHHHVFIPSVCSRYDALPLRHAIHQPSIASVRY